MARDKLSRKQLRVLDDLFEADMALQQVLQKHKVTAALFNRWQEDTNFVTEFDNRIAVLYRQSELIIARYASLAAAKLVELTESESQETARKACLDVIQLPKTADKKQPAQVDDQTQPSRLSPETASKLLAVLAQSNT